MTIQTILIIEDDRFIGEMYVRSLQKVGYSVDWMVDGNDGLIAARNKTYDLIILDIMLPEQRGDDILNALRNDQADLIPDTKVLVMTNFEQSDNAKLDITDRVDGYLIKADVTPRNLVEIIQSLDKQKKDGQ